MSKITLVRGAEEMPGEPVLAGVRRFLFGLFDGWSKNDKSGWRKLWKRLMDLEAGEFAVIEFVIMMEQGVERQNIQALLGHRDPKSTEVYLHVSNKSLMGIQSPFDRKAGADYE